MLLSALCPPGSHDSACPRHPYCAHPCALRAPPLPPAGQRLHPAVALPAVPALHAGPAPSSAHLRGLPGAFLPQGRLQGEREVCHLSVEHAVPRDGVHAGGAGVRQEEQWLLVPSAPAAPTLTPLHSPLKWTQGRGD